MAEIISFSEMNDKLMSEMKCGIFIYPTDTVYGIGCNAESKSLVEELGKAKRRSLDKPFLIIAPSKEYVLENFNIDEKQIWRYFDYAKSPTSLVLEKKDKSYLSHVCKGNTLGIRIPKHPMTKFLQKTGKPIITTSVNFPGERPANSIEEIPDKILNRVDYVIDGGKLSGTPSIVVQLIGKRIKVLRR